MFTEKNKVKWTPWGKKMCCVWTWKRTLWFINSLKQVSIRHWKSNLHVGCCRLYLKTLEDINWNWKNYWTRRNAADWKSVMAVARKFELFELVQFFVALILANEKIWKWFAERMQLTFGRAASFWSNFSPVDFHCSTPFLMW